MLKLDWDRKQMEELAEAMQVKIKRDVSRDWFVPGLEGDIYADGSGYSIGVLHTSVSAYKRTKTLLEQFTTIKQDGDTEGVFYLNRLPTESESEILRKRLKIRKTRKLSEEVKTKLRQIFQSNQQRKNNV